MPIFDDNRKFIEALEKAGEINRVKQEVDWDCEMGAIVRLASEQKQPAPFFQKIKDYPGWRVLGGPMANWKRMAIAMGLKEDATPKELINTFSARTKSPIKPMVVSDAPCQENVKTGKDVDLSRLPAPLVHDGDGGRYLSTWHCLIGKDPDSDYTNWGLYRQMVHNENHLGGTIGPTTDMGKIVAKYRERKQNAPFATAIGADPLSVLAASTVFPYTFNEVDRAGALRGKPVELVKCVTNDIMVPAHSEIVIEGEVMTQELVDEGPFGEWTGYRCSCRVPRAVYKVNAITYRNDPILTMTNMGVPVEEGQITWGSVGASAEIKKLLDAQGYPVVDVYLPPETVGHLVVVSVKKLYNNIASTIGHSVFGSVCARWSHMIIVVDDDVNIFNLDEVWHAVCTRVHPSPKGFNTMPGWGNPFAPYLNHHDRTWGYGGRVIIDATFPLEFDPKNEYPIKCTFDNIYDKDLQKKILKKWTAMGFAPIRTDLAFSPIKD